MSASLLCNTELAPTAFINPQVCYIGIIQSLHAAVTFQLSCCYRKAWFINSLSPYKYFVLSWWANSETLPEQCFKETSTFNRTRRTSGVRESSYTRFKCWNKQRRGSLGRVQWLHSVSHTTVKSRFQFPALLAQKASTGNSALLQEGRIFKAKENIVEKMSNFYCCTAPKEYINRGLLVPNQALEGGAL